MKRIFARRCRRKRTNYNRFKRYMGCKWRHPCKICKFLSNCMESAYDDMVYVDKNGQQGISRNMAREAGLL